MTQSSAALKSNFPPMRIDLRWVLNELVNDQRIRREDANLVLSLPREKAELNWHPLQLVAKRDIKDLSDPSKNMSLDRLTEWLAQKAGQPVFYIDPLKINVPAITSIMSYAYAERHNILALDVKSDEVIIASAQPFHSEWIAGLQHTLKHRTITRVVANSADLARYTLEFYTLARSVLGAKGEEGQTLTGVTNFEQLLELGKLGSPDANDKHIVNIVDWLLQYAFSQRASDIHIEPRREVGKVRFRIDGVMHQVYELPAAVTAAVVSRIKILGRMDVAEKRRPQDGRLKTKSRDGNEIELRLSTLPTAFGEKLVMRIFDPDVLVRTYAELGLSNEDYAKWQAMVTNSNGIVLVTGPTGSGKTTTLYSTLKQLATEEVNVCTIEDPIEMIEPAFNQMQALESIDLGFAEGVRALMRQDPDIIMVGEIRDLATADMAIQAALTGHLVISTLHTNDAPSAITRLIDLGVAPYLISATVLGVMAQRLARTLCKHCKAPVDLDEEGWKLITYPWKSSAPKTMQTPVGCLECRGTGYLGRLGVYELMPMTQTLKEMVSRNAPLQELRKQAYKEGMHTLRLSGAQKVAAGLTTIEEVLRVTPATDAV